MWKTAAGLSLRKLNRLDEKEVSRDHIMSIITSCVGVRKRGQEKMKEREQRREETQERREKERELECCKLDQQTSS